MHDTRSRLVDVKAHSDLDCAEGKKPRNARSNLMGGVTIRAANLSTFIRRKESVRVFTMSATGNPNHQHRSLDTHTSDGRRQFAAAADRWVEISNLPEFRKFQAFATSTSFKCVGTKRQSWTSSNPDCTSRVKPVYLLPCWKLPADLDSMPLTWHLTFLGYGGSQQKDLKTALTAYMHGGKGF